MMESICLYANETDLIVKFDIEEKQWYIFEQTRGDENQCPRGKVGFDQGIELFIFSNREQGREYVHQYKWVNRCIS